MILETPNFYCIKLDVEEGCVPRVFFGPNGLRVVVKTGPHSGWTKTVNLEPALVYIADIAVTVTRGTLSVLLRKRKSHLKNEVELLVNG
jgi:hypothetical protein